MQLRPLSVDMSMYSSGLFGVGTSKSGTCSYFPYNSSCSSSPCGVVLHSLCEFLSPAGYTAGRKTGNRARRKGEKEKYGLLCAVICCAQPPPPPPPPLPHPARHFTCLQPGLSGLEEQGRVPSTPYPYPFWTV